ncbi:MAG: Precorrin-2 dehydrogenase [Methanonatronarchaeales archaeon]|nr:Precorrin-2 dehydrogenase [Methanonatronarchaeales archaeon]
MIPLVHDLTGKKVVIFGGGDVGERKARFFEGECEVVVVSRDFNEGLMDLDVELLRGDVEGSYAELLDGAFLAVPATSNRVLNAEIEVEAGARGVLVNRVDGPGEVIVPSVVDFEDFAVSITTFGESPATSKFIRERIEEILGEEYRGMVEIQRRARDLLKGEVEEQMERGRALAEVMEDEEVWSLLREGRTEDAWRRGKEVLRVAV